MAQRSGTGHGGSQLCTSSMPHESHGDIAFRCGHFSLTFFMPSGLQKWFQWINYSNGPACLQSHCFDNAEIPSKTFMILFLAAEEAGKKAAFAWAGDSMGILVNKGDLAGA